MSYTQRAYKPKRHIIVDVESLSVRRNAAVIDIGAVVVDFNRPCNDTFQIFIRTPEQREAEQVFDIDEGTIAFHTGNDPQFIDECETKGVSFQEAINQFSDWINMQSQEVELHLWSQGKDFDFPILENMMHAAGVKIPWAYSRVHCLRDLVWLNPGARIKDAGPVAHKALLDAQHEAQQLVAVVKNSSWYQRLFK